MKRYTRVLISGMYEIALLEFDGEPTLYFKSSDPDELLPYNAQHARSFDRHHLWHEFRDCTLEEARTHLRFACDLEIVIGSLPFMFDPDMSVKSRQRSARGVAMMLSLDEKVAAKAQELVAKVPFQDSADYETIRAYAQSQKRRPGFDILLTLIPTSPTA